MSNKKNIKIIAVIQARMGSTRLPGKALKKILSRSLIEWIRYRLSFCREIDEIVLSTADNKENDPLVELAKSIGLKYYRGSEKDLVSRIYETAKKFKADAVVRITADCPLVDPYLVDKLVVRFKKDFPKIDYVCNILPPTFPDGIDIEVISFKALEKLYKEVKDPLYREWITTTIIENPDRYKIVNIKNKNNISYLRLTVDYAEDFELVEKIFGELHQEGDLFTLEDILNLFRKKPEFLKINEKHIDMTILNNLRSAEFHRLKSINNK